MIEVSRNTLYSKMKYGICGKIFRIYLFYFGVIYWYNQGSDLKF